jgi:hypothetical protein
MSSRPHALFPVDYHGTLFRPHAKFTAEDDKKLLQLVQQLGLGQWVSIAAQMPQRNSRQCRERYMKYLDPSLNTSPWTEHEDNLLMAKFKELGSRWMLMVPFFSNRTDAMIKNRYQVLARKQEPDQGSLSTGTLKTNDIFDNATLRDEIHRELNLGIPVDNPRFFV